MCSECHSVLGKAPWGLCSATSARLSGGDGLRIQISAMVATASRCLVSSLIVVRECCRWRTDWLWSRWRHARVSPMATSADSIRVRARRAYTAEGDAAAATSPEVRVSTSVNWGARARKSVVNCLAVCLYVARKAASAVAAQVRLPSPPLLSL